MQDKRKRPPAKAGGHEHTLLRRARRWTQQLPLGGCVGTSASARLSLRTEFPRTLQKTMAVDEDLVAFKECC